MMTRDGGKNREQIEFTSLDELVPEDHLVRKLENAIDWSFIYGMVADSYCEDNGRPSIDPVILIKLPVVQYMFGIRVAASFGHLRFSFQYLRNKPALGLTKNGFVDSLTAR